MGAIHEIGSTVAIVGSTMVKVRATGIRVAIDDFGTGYSSFAALAELPIDILKIDKRFIDNIVRTDEGHGFVKAIMQLAQTLGLETIAEGVEQPEQADALTALGCTQIQGYLYSPAIPADQTARYLQDNIATSSTARVGVANT